MLKRFLSTFLKLLLFVAYFVGLFVYDKIVFEGILFNAAQWNDPSFVLEDHYPGDELYPHALRVDMNAVVIEGTPEQIWPWLTQIGQDKAGWYSYSLFENLFGANITNLDYLLHLPDPVVGDIVYMGPKEAADSPHAQVARIERPSVLVFYNRWGNASIPIHTWAFILQPVDRTHTRLIVRMRTIKGGVPEQALTVIDYVGQPIHYMMERKMIQGIKERAEGRVPAFWRLQVEPIAYIVLFVEWLVYGLFGVLSMSAQGTQALVLSCISAFTLLLATVPHLPECVTVMLALLFLSAAPHLFSSCGCRRKTDSSHHKSE